MLGPCSSASFLWGVTYLAALACAIGQNRDYDPASKCDENRYHFDASQAAGHNAARVLESCTKPSRLNMSTPMPL